MEGKMEDYEVLKLLGKGSFGSVYCVKRTADRSLHVMKKISIHDMPPKERKATEQECKVLQRLRHPGIVCYEDSFIHKNRQLCIVMAFCEGGDLATVIEKRKMRYFPESEVISWLIQIGLALQYMHDAHILHRDLKTQNIFLTKSNFIKLGDFGIAKVLEGTLEMAKTVIGTPYYMSPELFRNQAYSYKSDMWSLGCVLFEMLALRHAFEARDMNGLVQKIVRGAHAPLPSGASGELRELVRSLLSLSPKGRPSVTEMLTLPFIRKEMGAYIRNQLGDSGAAELLRDDARLLGFHHEERDHLQQQARKLGFDLVKPASLPDPLPSHQAAAAAPAALAAVPVKPPSARPAGGDAGAMRRELPAPPPAGGKPSSLPQGGAEAAAAEQRRAEEAERQRMAAAKAFLERELRAKERAEAALRQLMQEKQARMKQLQEQRELQKKRMAAVHPKGEAGLLNEWQQRLARYHAQHEQRRRDQGYHPPPGVRRRPGDPAAAAAARPNNPADDPAAAGGPAGRPDDAAAGEVGAVPTPAGRPSVLELRNQAARAAAAGGGGGGGVEGGGVGDKENVRNAAATPALPAGPDAAELARVKAAENGRLRDELNREMERMEVKLEQLKLKKEAHDRRRRDNDPPRPRNNPPPQQPEQQQPHPQSHSEPSAPPFEPPRPPAPGGPKDAQLQPPPPAGIHQALPGRFYPQPAAASAAPTPGPGQPGYMVRMRGDPQPGPGAVPRDPAQLFSAPGAFLPGFQPPRPPQGRAEPAAAGGKGYGGEGVGPNVMQILQLPRANYAGAKPAAAVAAPAPPNRLQVVPKMEGGWSSEGILEDEGLNASLILRQKELDRTRARNIVAQDTERELREFQMTMHRINRAIGASAAQRPMLLPGEVGVKISERDRMLRDRQRRAMPALPNWDVRPGPGPADYNKAAAAAAGGGVRYTGFSDVAIQGAFAPVKGGHVPHGQAGLEGGPGFLDDLVEDNIWAEAGGRGGGGGGGVAEEVEEDEELLYYDREVAKVEHELAQRTLKIQMLQTAVLASGV